MATLTRSKEQSLKTPESLLISSVPTPFPITERERLLREECQAQQISDRDGESSLTPEEANTQQDFSTEASVSLIHHFSSRRT